MKLTGKYKRKISEALSDEMQELFLSGLSMKEVAEFAGISRQAVHQHFQKLKIKRHANSSCCPVVKHYKRQFDDHVTHHNGMQSLGKWMASEAKTTQVSEDLYRQRQKAYIATQNALKRGILRPQPCEVCGEEKAQAHHDDYTKPLDVRWLCVRHHNEWHRINGKGKLTTGLVADDGQLSREGFRAICTVLFGRRGWQVGCVQFLTRPDGTRVNTRTVRRWSNGETPVPFEIAILLRAELAKRNS